MVVLVGAAAIAIDAGAWRYQQRIQQTAADSAALAGAAELAYTSANDVTAAAHADAASNGFTDGAAGVSVTVHKPPASGSYSGQSNAVEVIVSKPASLFFGHALGLSAPTVSARAVAMQNDSGGGCVIALSTTATATFSISGGTLNAHTCGVVSDGPWNMTGGTVDAAMIAVAGALTKTGGTYAEATPHAALAIADPCSAISGCDYLKSSAQPTAPCQPTSSVSSGTVTLSPGVYCNGLKVAGGTVTLSPGVYDIYNKPLSVTGGTVTGSGVTFYIGSGSSVDLTGGVTTLAAPLTGNTAGILVYQTSSNTAQAKVTGGTNGTCPIVGTPSWQGMFYAPAANLDVTGGNWTPSTVITDTYTTTGASTCVTIPTGGTSPLKRTALAE